VTDGRTALALAREWRPDVITLDVLMPRLDGWAVLTALKSDRDLAEIPVIIVTVLADRGIAVSLGAAELLTKPVDRARLAATIRQNVRGTGIVLVVDDEPESRRIGRLMPGMNGFAFLEEIAKHAELREIPIVILTAMPLGAAERELLSRRTRDVIAKGADDLAQVLRRILVRLPKTAEVAAAG
jgi:CheY-like chemotaxis protein